MPRLLGNDSFYVVRAALVWSDQLASYWRDWQNPAHTLVTNAQVQPFKLSEKLNVVDYQEREFAQTGLRFFAPADTDVTKDDRVLYRGALFNVLGHPGYWTNFRGQVDHIAFIAQHREG